MLIAFVQRVVRAFHENLGPLDQPSGEETTKGADEDFLEECGVHPVFTSNESARIPIEMLIRHKICEF